MKCINREMKLAGIESADLSVCNSAATFLQSAFWGSFKARFGWSAGAFMVYWENLEAEPMLLISRRICRGLSFAYVPWYGRGLSSGPLAELAGALRGRLPRDTAFIRFDPPWYTEADEEPPLLEKPFVRAAADVQCPHTVLIDLTQSMDEIRAGMKPKWRYNAGLSLKRGVIIRQSGGVPEQDLKSFYALFEETARRDGIAIHSPDYYRGLFVHAAQWPGGGQELRLYTASHEGEDIAAIVVLLRGSEAVYLYGASGGLKRNLMAPHALQMKAMEDAKEAGCLTYDLFGIAPGADPSHPMAGLYFFKTGFGGKIIHRPGSWDYVYRPLVYRLFRGAESLRKHLRNFRKKPRGS
ncbi:MAG: peptidoglycan bridge formation glycyltransferase FemA/FemB family protein [Treponema sp.]|nr:peptidoglycan bridge formation glycyltransferase FemA/FemB family protein [Treponema sp.]